MRHRRGQRQTESDNQSQESRDTDERAADGKHDQDAAEKERGIRLKDRHDRSEGDADKVCHVHGSMGELIKLAWVAERVVKGRSGPGGRR